MRKYQSVGAVSVEFGLTLISSQGSREVFGLTIQTGSEKLRTFKRYGPYCKHCGIKGQLFSVDRDDRKAESDRRHLNLWAFNDLGEYVMMTSDHVVPLARGGARISLKNRQTLCHPCNTKKGKKLESEL